MESRLNFRTVTDLEEAKALFEQFTDGRTLFDTWEFRYCFYKYDNFPLKFIVGSDGDQPIGLLPMQFDTEKGHLEFFGSSWMEETKVYLKPGYEWAMPEFYAQVNEPAMLNAILPADEFTRSLPLDDYNYRIDLSGFSGYWDFINTTHNPKGQQTWKRKIRKLEEHRLETVYNDWNDLALLIENNIKTFGPDSSFNDPKRCKIYADFEKLEDCEKFLKTLVVDGVKQSVTLSLFFNGVFYYMNAGSNFEAVPNLGSYAIMLDIQKAIELKAHYFNALMCSYNWKERWHLTPYPLNKFEKLLPV